MLGQQDMVWDCAGDLRNSVSEEEHAKGRTWDVNLAIALLDATCGEGLGGEFWESYTGAYPRPESVTVPFCLPQEQLQAATERASQEPIPLLARPSIAPNDCALAPYVALGVGLCHGEIKVLQNWRRLLCNCADYRVGQPRHAERQGQQREV